MLVSVGFWLVRFESAIARERSDFLNLMIRAFHLDKLPDLQVRSERRLKSRHQAWLDGDVHGIWNQIVLNVFPPDIPWESETNEGEQGNGQHHTPSGSRVVVRVQNIERHNGKSVKTNLEPKLGVGINFVNMSRNDIAHSILLDIQHLLLGYL
ncbi:hypothetical protein D3C84_634790 [compost metagenome]